MPDPADALAKAAAAVTGPGTPNAASVQSTPSSRALWALIGAGPAISAMVLACLWLLAFRMWPDVVEWRAVGLAERIVVGVTGIAMVLAVLLGLVVFRLASGGLKSVSPRAFGGSLEVNTGDETPDVRS